jgi:hypothetical protein
VEKLQMMSEVQAQEIRRQVLSIRLAGLRRIKLRPASGQDFLVTIVK